MEGSYVLKAAETIPTEIVCQICRLTYISAQRVIRVVMECKSKAKDAVTAFVEEAVVRRELSDNFCFYNDSIEGADEWARCTLKAHESDQREHLYTLEQLERAETHDLLWNAAQLQMTRDGKMHGFMRMYWAKKILEWTTSASEALKFAIFLNDKYELDGCDPNGYVGCAWSICGIHDHGFAERAVFGKIRYMTDKGCQRKFDVDHYIDKHKK
jgi:deoxyribodipyrimidine photo-lyase